jgi:hypothetical protein
MASIGIGPAVPEVLPAAASASVALGPLDLRRFLAAPLRREPYPYVAAESCLLPESLAALREDLPRLTVPGYHPTDTFAPAGAFAALLLQIEEGVLLI